MADPLTQQAKSPGLSLDVSSLKVPPHSIEAEQSLLGGLMLSNEAWDRVMELVTEADFYRHEHRLIFAALAALAAASHPFDVITLSEYLNGKDELDSVGGLPYLGDLVRNTPSAANVQAYALIVRERSTMRQLIAAATEISTLNFNPEGRTGAELLEEAERRIMEIGENRVQRGGPEAVNELLRRAVDRIDELYDSKSKITGQSTGFIDLDDRTSGLQRADLVIVAGRPSMGKTAFAMNLVENAVLKQDRPVLV
ncbi:MAG: replicative DNA helicase, partial [Pseudomonadales bacterium]|nr:replicative DNA helicase [Pseudomonadales bacterium]